MSVYAQHSYTHHLKEAAKKLRAHTDVPSKMLTPLFIIDAYGSRSYFIAALGWFALFVVVEPLRDVLDSLWLGLNAWIIHDSVQVAEEVMRNASMNEVAAAAAAAGREKNRKEMVAVTLELEKTEYTHDDLPLLYVQKESVAEKKAE